jgi:hypothetical protein
MVAARLLALLHNLNLVLHKYLHKGVLTHSFLDQSGCVFLNLSSGETLSILMSETDLFKVLSGATIMDKNTAQSIAIMSLVQKNILLPLNSKNTDV